MGVNSLRSTVTRQRRGFDLNPGPSAPESSTLTTRLDVPFTKPPPRLPPAATPPRRYVVTLQAEQRLI